MDTQGVIVCNIPLLNKIDGSVFIFWQFAEYISVS
jgi:hypothetical protein